ncbi:YbaK/aminoacyl-tRNA synthetase-associated domain-containing protein [Tribonema minus]|uniref:YbaK/aminoacyl-tRNA synthetase-associated domain-containing protein n=1 Tax=Tribonema minus TaxID=303371 RepID=A0A836CLD2_9STRA|nr:YbaK/aminoacyl-tRNA synthetase-associated domain-containing protein [Tribonema minus]
MSVNVQSMTSAEVALQRLQDLEARVATILRAQQGDKAALTDPVERVKAEAQKCLSARFKWVEPTYYDKSLEERATILRCHPRQLTKSLLFKGNAGSEAADSSGAAPVYMMVIVQYLAKINLKLLQEVGNALLAGRQGQKRLSFALAPDEEGLALTGFPHNGVSPFGSLCRVPMVLSSAIAELPEQFLWMGGGHTDLKIGVSVQDLVRALNAHVADVSEPRDDEE